MTHHYPHRWWRWLGLLVCSLTLLGPPVVASAHFGEPYAVLIDQPVGPYLVTTYVDPDVGTGTFLVKVQSASGTVAAATTVILNATPEDNHTAPSFVVVKGQRDGTGQEYEGKVDFDAEGYWSMRMQVAGPAGAGDITFRVLVTPPYPQWLSTLQCLVPFVVIAGLWFLAMKRNAIIKRRAAAAAAPTDTSTKNQSASIQE